MSQLKLISEVGEDINLSKLNKKFIEARLNNDELIKYLINNFKVLENIPYIKFLENKTEIIEDESLFPPRQVKNVEETRMKLLKLHFRIDFKGEVEDVEVKVFIPKLYKKYNYLLNGNKYFPIYQLVDSATYNTKDAVILKSVLHPIIIKKEKASVKILPDTDSTSTEYIFVLSLFKRKINVLNYFLAEFGFDETLKLLEIDDRVLVVDTDSYDDPDDEWIKIDISKTNQIWIWKEDYTSNMYFHTVCNSIINLFNKKTVVNIISDKQYWVRKLGSMFTKNPSNQLEKGESVCISLKRLLDDSTKESLRISDEHKEDTYKLIIYICQNFETLFSADNYDLRSKKLRMDYQIDSIVRKNSTNTYRLLNTRHIKMKTIKSIFAISPLILIKYLQTSQLLRYDNLSSDFSILNLLKFSQRGPSATEGSSVPIDARAIHPTHLGKITLNSCSAGDPGMSGTLSPFIRTNTYFDEEGDDGSND